MHTTAVQVPARGRIHYLNTGYKPEPKKAPLVDAVVVNLAEKMINRMLMDGSDVNALVSEPEDFFKYRKKGQKLSKYYLKKAHQPKSKKAFSVDAASRDAASELICRVLWYLAELYGLISDPEAFIKKKGALEMLERRSKAPWEDL